jgi:hypothetical protein
MSDPVDLRDLVAAYLGGSVPIETLDSAVAAIGEDPAAIPAELVDLWGTLELRLAELTSGRLDAAEFRGALLAISPASVVVSEQPFTVIVSTGTSVRLSSGVSVGEARPSPVAGTRLVGAHG